MTTVNEFVRDGVKYVAQAKRGCRGCAFHRIRCADTPPCYPEGRDDGQGIIWVRADGQATVDIADIIAGALKTSRARAFELMQAALDAREDGA